MARITNEELILAVWLFNIAKIEKLFFVATAANGNTFLSTIKHYLPAGIRAEEVINAASCSDASNSNSYEGELIRLSRSLCGNNTTLSGLKPLVNPLSTLQLEGKKPGQAAFRAIKVMKGEAIFAAHTGAINTEQYKTHFNSFIKDLEALKGKEYEDFMRCFDTLAEYYFWCVASDDSAMISLYQSAKTQAAFASALFRYHEAKNTQTLEALDASGEKKFLFIKGDTSGMRRYIFDLKQQKDNAKLLRARSFQIWALGECIARHIAFRFNVSSENIIMSAGGKFLVVVPNSDAAEDLIKELRLELETYCIKEFAGTLIFILSDGVPASIEDIQKTALPKLLNEIDYRAECAEQKKMQVFLGSHSSVLDEHYEALLLNGACSRCGALPAHKDGICMNCANLIETGGRLIKASTVIVNYKKLLPFSEMVSVSKNDCGGAIVNDYKPGRASIYLPYFAPVDQNNTIALFEELAQRSNGINKLAIFKADIDNLDLLFSTASGEGISLPLYAELSRRFQYFFTGYYHDYIQQHGEYKQKIYTIFSGDDDLCLLGAWDAVLRFAAGFRAELDTLTNNNPSITLSGGIALIGPALPVRTMAQEAEAALKSAKDRRDKGAKPLKDGICIFGVTLGWDEYKEYLDDGIKLAEHLAQKNISARLLYKMIEFANRAKNFKNGSLRDRVWKSNFIYMKARNIDNLKLEQGKKDELEKMFSKFGCDDNIEKSRIAVSYALYANRRKDNHG